MIDLATDNNPPRRRPRRPRATLPAYGVPDGVCGFRHGLSDGERATIDSALAIVGRHLCTRPVCNTPGAVRAYLNLQIGAEPVEHFAVLFLDATHHAIAYEVFFRGTLTQTSVYPRELVRAALRHGAAAVVLAHNHPSGDPTPSRADEALTQTTKAALALVDVRLLDHFIVNGREALSFAEKGLL